MPSSQTSASTLLGVLAMYRRLLGRRLYALAVLMPLSSISESFGIALLLPLLASLEEGQALAGQGGGAVEKALAWLPLPTSPLPLLALIAVAFLLKGALKFVTEAVRGFFQAKLIYRLKTQFLSHYTHLAFSAFSQRNTGHYVNLVEVQTNRMAQAFKATSTLLVQAVGAVVYLSIAALVNWQFAVVAGVAGAVFMLGMKGLTSRVRALSRQTSAEHSHLNKQFVQVLHAMKYLMATHRTEQLGERIRASCGRLFGYQLWTYVAQSFTQSLREPISVILVLGLIAAQLFFFEQPLGPIFVALLLLHRTTQAMFTVQQNWQAAMEFSGSAEMVQEELEFCRDHQEKRGPTTLPAFQESVEFQKVSFAYDRQDELVLHSVDFKIPRNQTIALVGHSGAGKSTLADLLTLLLRPSQGRILIDGRDAAAIDPTSWRSQLGYVCQETVVFDETIAANICLSEADYANDPDCRHRVQEAARKAFAEEFIEALPDRYDTIVGDRGIRLSGGQRQRLFIARELYKQPELLILDEATSALDGESERAIQRSIDALHGQITVVVIAHRLSTIKNADYIYVLDRGEVVEEGAYDDLHGDADSRFRRMVELQSL